MADYQKHRRTGNRCESVKVEYGTANATEKRRRSWRCQLVNGHTGTHISFSGHRKWDEAEGRLF